jgi:exodeoxyribonuclease VII large subunit
MKKQAISLTQLLSKVKNAINSQFDFPLWVVAEIISINDRNRGGHNYIELLDVDESGTEKSKHTAIIWKSVADKLKPKFKEATGYDLAVGMKVLLNIQVSFSERFGLQLVINDIDPSFTVGDMEQKLKKIVTRLQQEGSYLKNKQLSPPLEFTSLAVISPRGAAGLRDFQVDADKLMGICKFEYFNAVFEGDASAKSIREAFMDVFKADKANGQPKYDAVIFIRGGGSKTALNYINDYTVANCVCNMPFPVIVGVGHEIDKTILDDIACLSFDTPSKVIGHIQNTIALNAREAIEKIFNIESITTNLMSNEVNVLEGKISKIKANSIGTISNFNEDLIKMESVFKNTVNTTLTSSKSSLNSISESIKPTAESILNKVLAEMSELSLSFENKVSSMVVITKERLSLNYLMALSEGPKATMDRGYSIVKKESKGIKTVSELKVGDGLDILMADGEIKTSIIEVNSND